jgi:hypothetical protein
MIFTNKKTKKGAWGLPQKILFAMIPGSMLHSKRTLSLHKDAHYA